MIRVTVGNNEFPPLSEFIIFLTWIISPIIKFQRFRPLSGYLFLNHLKNSKRQSTSIFRSLTGPHPPARCQPVNAIFTHIASTGRFPHRTALFLHFLQSHFALSHHILFPIQLCTLQHMGWHTKAYILVVLMLPRHIGPSEDILCYPDSFFLLEKIIDNRLWDKSTAAAKKYCCIWDWCHTLIRKMLLKSFLISLIKDFNRLP